VPAAVALARDGFVVSFGLARSLKSVLPDFKKYPASLVSSYQNKSPKM
jgi:hypothetical protein